MKKIIFVIYLQLLTVIVFSQNIYTVAGSGSVDYYADNIQATDAGIVATGAIALDQSGNIYIADMYHNRIRKVDAFTGIITTIAGTGVGGYNGDNISATSAQIHYPMSVAVDEIGNVYFGDYSNNRVRKIDISTGLISTIAGTGVYGYNGDSIIATAAKITETTGIALDASGNIYFSDLGNSRIRKIDMSSGYIYSIAGTGINGYNGDTISALTAKLNFPHGIDVDIDGNIFIADKENNRIRKIDISSGMIYTVAGSGVYDIYNGDNIPATTAKFRYPNSVAVDESGNIYISDQNNNMIHKVIKSSGLIFTIAGTGSNNYTPDGAIAETSSISEPRGVAIDACGNVYISEYNSRKIRKVFTYSITPNVTNIDCYGECNGSVTAVASGGVTPYNFEWLGLGSGSSHSNVCSDRYSLIVTDSTGCFERLLVHVTQPDSIRIWITTVSSTCEGNGQAADSLITGGTPPYSLLWPNGQTTEIATGLSAGTYVLTVTDANNCNANQQFTIASDNSQFLSAPICMVTVDTLSQNNIIVWDKSLFTYADSFIVYREISTNNYQPIASISNDSLSQFIDTVRAKYFPNTGDPNLGTYRYKLQTLDTCGNFSEFSPYHNTIFIMNMNGTFYWTQPYSIENSSNPVTSYILMRDNYSNGNWQVINSVAGTQQTINDPLYVIYKNTASWRVITQWSISCTPVLKNTNSYSYSISNIYRDFVTNSNFNSNENILNVYPSLTNGIIYINNIAESEISVFNITGQKVLSKQLTSVSNSVDISFCTDGIYFVKVSCDKDSKVCKIILKK